MKLSAMQIAQQIKNEADQLGWSVIVRGSILEITKRISSREDFVTADMQYGCILGLCPRTSPGSTWGTDGGGVGAVAAMTNGVFNMKMSGGSKSVLNALKKII